MPLRFVTLAKHFALDMSSYEFVEAYGRYDTENHDQIARKTDVLMGKRVLCGVLFFGELVCYVCVGYYSKI